MEKACEQVVVIRTVMILLNACTFVMYVYVLSYYNNLFKESELQRLSKTREAELKYQHEQNTLDVTKAKEMSSIETEKFKNMVSSIGSDTIQAIATAGPEMQVCAAVTCCFPDLFSTKYQK